MKKLIILIISATLTLGLTFCGNNGAIAEFEKGIKKMEILSETITKATSDEVIDDSEAEKINKLFKEFKEFSDIMEEKEDGYDDAQKEAIKEFEEKNKEKLEKVSQDLMEALMSLMSCEGADKIKDMF
jgi:molecular chaperone GrpE (heat shock protein)